MPDPLEVTLPARCRDCDRRAEVPFPRCWTCIGKAQRIAYQVETIAAQQQAGTPMHGGPSCDCWECREEFR